MSTPLAAHRFSLDGWECGVIDAAGVQWRLLEVDGWYGRAGVSPRTTRTDRPGRDGQLRGRSYRSERIISLSGLAYAPDAATLEAAGQTIASLCDDATVLHTLIGVDASGIDKQAAVELNAESKFSHQTERVAAWQIQLAAPDPRRYATTAQAASCGLATTSGGLVFPLVFPLDFGSSGGGTLTVTNAGDTHTWPVWTITGPAVNPVIINTDTGQRLALSGLTVDAGQTLTLDTDARTVLLAGVASRRGALTADSAWFPLRPGVTRLAFQAGAYDPAASLSATWRSAWS